MKSVLTVIVIFLLSSAASATTYTYRLGDHPNGNQQANYDYGLRLDENNLYYTFQNGNAVLTYDDVLLTASITGTVNESTLGDVTSLIDTTISYTLSGITDAGGGFFTATGGSGAVGALGLIGKQAGSGLA